MMLDFKYVMEQVHDRVEDPIVIIDVIQKMKCVSPTDSSENFLSEFFEILKQMHPDIALDGIIEELKANIAGYKMEITGLKTENDQLRDEVVALRNVEAEPVQATKVKYIQQAGRAHPHVCDVLEQWSDNGVDPAPYGCVVCNPEAIHTDSKTPLILDLGASAPPTPDGESLKVSQDRVTSYAGRKKIRITPIKTTITYLSYSSSVLLQVVLKQIDGCTTSAEAGTIEELHAIAAKWMLQLGLQMDDVDIIDKTNRAMFPFISFPHELERELIEQQKPHVPIPSTPPVPDSRPHVDKDQVDTTVPGGCGEYPSVGMPHHPHVCIPKATWNMQLTPVNEPPVPGCPTCNPNRLLDPPRNASL